LILAGYLPFIECREESIWDQGTWNEWEVTDETNVYDEDICSDGSPTSMFLRPTVQMYKKWIAHPDIPAPAQGVRLASLLQSCMIKRTYVSKVQGKPILDAIPIAHSQQAICTFTGDEKTVYNDLSKEAKRKFMRVNKRTGKMEWNWR